MDDNSSFSSSNLDFAKIVATPTNDSWSQVYHAGKLFSVLALKKEAKEEESEEQTLGTIGKEVLKTLEEEYFTLPQKNFDTIKQAVIFATEKITKDLVSTFIIGSFIDNILYVFIKGKGIVLLKRGEAFGTILHSANNEEISGASGFLEDKDLVVLETSEFSKIISQEDLKNAQDDKKASEIAEILTPKIHEKEEGQASAVIIIFNKPQKEEEQFSFKENAREIEPQESKLEEKETIETKVEPEEKESINKVQEEVYKQENKRKINFPKFAFSLNHKKKIFLSISLILFAVLISTVFLSFLNKENAKNQALVNEIYTNANKKYEEGNALLGLNAILGREDLLEAKKILEEGKTKFKKDSKEDKKISELLKKVDEALSSSSNASLAKTKKVDASKSKLLNLMLSNNASYVSFYENDFYYSKDEGIFSEDKLVLKKDWEVMGGLGAYIGNLYVLDKNKNQIFKFTKSGSDYSKSNYLQTSADLSRANSIAIDGSIWVLSSRSEILKFNRGNQENFSISGLEQPFSAQSRIFTNADTENLYILDKENQRIVVLGKDGKYKSQYASGILKDAKDFEVKEKDKKAFILSQNSIYELSLE